MAIPPNGGSEPLSAEQLEILESVFKLASEESDWPKRNRLRIPYNERGGDFDPLERSLVPWLLVPFDRAWNDQRLRLRMAGLALCRRGKPIIEAFLSLVREAARRFIDDPSKHAEVRASDFKSYIPEADHDLFSLGSLAVLEEHGWISGGTNSPLDAWVRRIGPEAVALHDVASLEDFYARRDSLRAAAASPSESQVRLLRVIYRHWRRFCGWPEYVSLLIAHRCRGHVERMLETMPRDFVSVMGVHSDLTGRRVRLTLEAVAATGLAADDIDLLSRIVQAMRRRCVAGNGEAEVAPRELADELKVAESLIVRVGFLLQHSVHFGVSILDRPPSWIAIANDKVLDYRDAVGVEPFLRRYRELSRPAVPTQEVVNTREWQVVGKLGAGGQASAYRIARRSESGPASHVMKVLKPWKEAPGKAKSESEQRARFRYEVETLRLLNNLGCPGIVRVVDQDLEPPAGCQPWFVMPLYPAGAMCSLDEKGKAVYLEPFQGNLDRVLQIAESLAATLAFMHANEAVHRDVKTPNVLFAERGGPPVLADMGLAFAEALPRAFATGEPEALGPWQWRPPELHPGSTDKRNPKSDIYLLGGLIYEALTGGASLERPENPPGVFLHEKPDWSIGRFTQDPRVPHVNLLLRNMWAQDPDARPTAEQVVKLCQSIREWQPGRAEPSIEDSRLELARAAIEYRGRSKAYRENVLREQLKTTCQSVAREIGVYEPSRQYDFHRQVDVNYGDSEAPAYLQREFPDGVWMAVRTLVRFEPTPHILLLSYAFLVRTADNKEVVVAFDERKNIDVLSTSVPGDPSNVTCLKQRALADLERLAKTAAAKLKKLTE